MGKKTRPRVQLFGVFCIVWCSVFIRDILVVGGRVNTNCGRVQGPAAAEVWKLQQGGWGGVLCMYISGARCKTVIDGKAAQVFKVAGRLCGCGESGTVAQSRCR